mmetsp:Transcript_86262/g.279271  ORF Transcript_86262/g.279271 Transcript_86262/m.279271 type:complete len:263 (-) Transcript_86262:2-790(-)
MRKKDVGLGEHELEQGLRGVVLVAQFQEDLQGGRLHVRAHLRHWMVVVPYGLRVNREGLLATGVEKEHDVVPVQHGGYVLDDRHPEGQEVLVLPEVKLSGHDLIQVPARSEVAEESGLRGCGLQQDVDRLQDLRGDTALHLAPQGLPLREQGLEPVAQPPVHKGLCELLAQARLVLLAIGPSNALAHPLDGVHDLGGHLVLACAEAGVRDLLRQAVDPAAHVVELLDRVLHGWSWAGRQPCGCGAAAAPCPGHRAPRAAPVA